MDSQKVQNPVSTKVFLKGGPSTLPTGLNLIEPSSSFRFQFKDEFLFSKHSNTRGHYEDVKFCMSLFSIWTLFTEAVNRSRSQSSNPGFILRSDRFPSKSKLHKSIVVSSRRRISLQMYNSKCFLI